MIDGLKRSWQTYTVEHRLILWDENMLVLEQQHDYVLRSIHARHQGIAKTSFGPVNPCTHLAWTNVIEEWVASCPTCKYFTKKHSLEILMPQPTWQVVSSYFFMLDHGDYPPLVNNAVSFLSFICTQPGGASQELYSEVHEWMLCWT